MDNFEATQNHINAIKKCVIAGLVFAIILLAQFVYMEMMLQCTYAPNTYPAFTHYGILIWHKSYDSLSKKNKPLFCFTVVHFVLKYMLLIGYVVPTIILFAKSLVIINFANQVLDPSDCLDNFTTLLFVDMKTTFGTDKTKVIFAFGFVGFLIEPNFTYLLKKVILHLCCNVTAAYWKKIKKLVEIKEEK